MLPTLPKLQLWEIIANAKIKILTFLYLQDFAITLILNQFLQFTLLATLVDFLFCRTFFLTNDYLNGATAKRKADKNITFMLADRSHPTTSHPRSISTVTQI